MSDRPDPTRGVTAPPDGPTDTDPPPTVEARDDLEGCGCLECRNVDAITTRRTVPDALVWSVRLFRSRPSVLLFGVALVVVNRLLEIEGLLGLPTPAVGVLDAGATFAFVVSLRAYVAVIVAGELTDRSVTTRDALRRSLARTPALIGLFALLVVAVLIVPSLVTTPLFLLVALVAGDPVELVGIPVLAAVGGFLFAVPFLLLLFRFWLAPEACVVGAYGPLESLRISWRITSNHRRKALLVVLIAAGSATSLYLPGVLPDVGGPTPFGQALRVASACLGELLSVVWAGAYAHVYVQGVLE